MGATRSLISLSTANKQGCEIRATTICLSKANGTKINILGTTSLQVLEKGKHVHTIVAVLSQNGDQTIVGWKDLMAMGIISSDWPVMPRQETEGRILAADDDEEEKELGKLKTHMLNKFSTVFSDTINKKPIASTLMRDNIQITPAEVLRRQGHAGQPKSGSNKARARAGGGGDHSEGRQANHLDKPRILRPQAKRGGQVGHRLRGSSRTEQPDTEADTPVPGST
jgi:hypothetical protein